METFELKYFLAVAEFENLHRASEKLRVSKASLSKAIARLEDELGAVLFERHGRNIRITDEGTFLRQRATEIVRLEEATRIELAGHRSNAQCIIAGPEVLLKELGGEITTKLERAYPAMRFQFVAASDAGALAKVMAGEAHLALVTSPAPKELTQKVVRDVVFRTCVGEGHPLYRAARRGDPVPVEKVLAHPFVSPSLPLLGLVGARQSADGWRDDEFRRDVRYVTTSLAVLEQLVVSGKALAYLPEYLADRLGLARLEVTGCPFTCPQKVRIVARAPERTGWLSRLF